MERIVVNKFGRKNQSYVLVEDDNDKVVAIIETTEENQDVTDKVIQAINDDLAGDTVHEVVSPYVLDGSNVGFEVILNTEDSDDEEQEVNGYTLYLTEKY
ncbi:hypothetical protein [Flavobacterium sp.]|uniref:hypothetical protein n=1 Tax=Flavobacterium sp. TaxID=239 RepID=UPI002637BEAA|nr:hypothetical protein [Flavobacterium sp.]